MTTVFDPPYPGLILRPYALRYWVEGQPQPDPNGCPDGNVEVREVAYSAADAVMQGDLQIRRRWPSTYFHLCGIQPGPVSR